MTEFTSSYGAIAYTLLAVIITFSTMNYLYRSDRFIAAMTTLVLFVLIFTFFGLRWLSSSRAEGTGPLGEWPPVINTCPDFLVLYKRANGKMACIDIVGVAKQSGSDLTKILKTHVDYRTNPQALASMPDQSNGKYNFFTKLYSPGMTAAEKDAAVQEAIDFRLSWEGMADGKDTIKAIQSAGVIAAATESKCPPPPGCPAPATVAKA